ncbi:hypothetical protein SBDP1_1530023 [Syntrophobacter sp. SbD1]|nr:hypothetical protein SBDP1_1530023 [Syntrophobacter sp. SbD1]
MKEFCKSLRINRIWGKKLDLPSKSCKSSLKSFLDEEKFTNLLFQIPNPDKPEPKRSRRTRRIHEGTRREKFEIDMIYFAISSCSSCPLGVLRGPKSSFSIVTLQS